MVSGSLAVRENDISKETDIREIGTACLSCGARQGKAAEGAFTRFFPPREWEPIKMPAVMASGRHLDLNKVSRE